VLSQIKKIGLPGEIFIVHTKLPRNGLDLISVGEPALCVSESETIGIISWILPEPSWNKLGLMTWLLRLSSKHNHEDPEPSWSHGYDGERASYLLMKCSWI